MDHYHDFDAVRDAYETFVTNIPFYGFAVLCADHPEVQELIARVKDRQNHHLRVFAPSRYSRR